MDPHAKNVRNYVRIVCQKGDHRSETLGIMAGCDNSELWLWNVVGIMPICSMYGIFTYIWVILKGQMLVNIPAPWSIWDRYHLDELCCGFTVTSLE
jgi:hypothetical protein